MTAFQQAVRRVVSELQPGEVVTYGEVAAEAGRPGAARAVGSFLRVSGGGLPWWRVVGAGGRLASPSHEQQARLLRGEGHVVEGRRVRA